MNHHELLRNTSESMNGNIDSDVWLFTSIQVRIPPVIIPTCCAVVVRHWLSSIRWSTDHLLPRRTPLGSCRMRHLTDVSSKPLTFVM